MSTNDDGKPSFFARYIDGSEKEKLEPETVGNGSADLISRWAQEADIKTFLTHILASGPVPTITIEEQGAARGFSTRQLRRARELMGIITFKEEGKFGGGRWFWTFLQLTPKQITAIKLNDRYTRRLRDLSRTLGYRLQPRSVYPRPPRNEKDGQK